MHLIVIGIAVILSNPAIAAGPARGGAAPPPATPSAFVGVRVIPMRPAASAPTILENQTVLIRHGRILELGPRDEVPLPDQIRVIEGRGLTLLPGLADMHVHLWNRDEFILNLANGVTAVRNMWGTEMQLDWQRGIAAGELLGPTIYTTGPLMDGKPPIWPTSLVIEDVATARDEVRKQRQAGYGALKVYNRLHRDVYDAIVETAREVDLPVVGHVPDTVGLRHVLESGQASIEHLTGYLEFCRGGGAEASSAPLESTRLAEAVRLTLAAGTWNCVTLIVMQRWVGPEEARRFLEEPEMRYVAPSTRGSWDPRTDFRKQQTSEARYAAIRRDNAARQAITRALHEAGAPILLGTDTPNPYVVPGFAVPRELENLVAAGFSPYEALRAGTCDAAAFLGEASEFGTIAPGRRADLIALRADPLEDVGNVRQIAGVMVRGRWLPADLLHERLEDLAAGYERQLEEIADTAAGGDLFAGIPSLPTDGVEQAGGTYDMGAGGAVQAAERFSLREDADGLQAVHAQFVYPVYRLVTRLVYDPGEDGFGESLVWETTSSLGAESGEVVRDGDRLQITRTTGASETEEERTIDDGAFLYAPFIGIERMLLPFASRLNPDEATDLPIAAVDFSPTFRVHEGRLRIRRQADETRPGSRGKPIPVRVYRLEEIGEDGKATAGGVRVTLAVDAEGRIVERTTDTAMGSWTARRRG